MDAGARARFKTRLFVFGAGLMLSGLLVSGCTLPPDAIDEKSPTPGVYGALFDGETFAGWEGNTDLLRIEDGSFVGGNLIDTIEENEYLCTEESFADFELYLEARPSQEVANGGVMFRTRRIPESSDVIGYQADLGFLPGDSPKNIWGSLYDISRRRRFLAEPAPELIEAAYRPGDWNVFRIRAEGRRIQIYINETQTVEYVEEDPAIPQSGVICVQIHSGPPLEIRYRQIYLQRRD